MRSKAPTADEWARLRRWARDQVAPLIATGVELQQVAEDRPGQRCQGFDYQLRKLILADLDRFTKEPPVR